MLIGEVTLKWPGDDMSHSLYLFPRLSWARLNSVERSTQQNLVLVSSDRKRSLSPQPLSSKKSFRENHSKITQKIRFYHFRMKLSKIRGSTPAGVLSQNFCVWDFFRKTINIHRMTWYIILQYVCSMFPNMVELKRNIFCPFG